MYLVCKYKDNGQLFITTRAARETMINVLNGLGQIVDSTVEKVCDTYKQANDYKTEIEFIDKTIQHL